MYIHLHSQTCGKLMNHIVSSLLIQNLQIVTLFKVAILPNFNILATTIPFTIFCQIDTNLLGKEILCQFFCDISYNSMFFSVIFLGPKNILSLL